MKYVVAFFIVCSSACAEIVTVNYRGTVTEVTGLPFGIAAVPGVTPVTGVMKYDTAAERFRPDTVTNSSRYVANIASGFSLTIGGVTISSSDFSISATNNVTNFGGSDLLQSVADNDGLESTEFGDDFRVNGIPGEGSAQVLLADTDRTLFPTDVDVDVLPHPSLLGQIDFVWGYLGDDLGTGGGIANNLVFTGIIVPEPGTLLLFALLMLSVVLRRHR